MAGGLTNAIELRNVTLTYDERVILDDVSFTVKPGETKILMGGSGTGKSTVLKLVLGLIKPDSGRILIDGEECHGEACSRLSFSSIRSFQSWWLFELSDSFPRSSRAVSIRSTSVLV